ncbi:unnamed protein product, partial [Rotaria sp. Silwood1]
PINAVFYGLQFGIKYLVKSFYLKVEPGGEEGFATPCTNRWLININIILRCLIQNLTEDVILTRWNDVLSSVNGTRDETFSVALL